jgi:hypothetical protein
MAFRNDNAVFGLAPNGQYQVGKSNYDSGSQPESGQLIPYAAAPSGSYMYFECTVGQMLDSGIVVHSRLPQVNKAPDTLSSAFLDDPNLDTYTALGVNLKCQDQYADIVQRMGHSRYWFRLWGEAIRIGFQVPIPGIKVIGGVPAVPYDKNPQWAFNRIAPGGNYSGIIMWHAAWSLWYTTAVPPTSNTFPAADPSAHISVATPQSQGYQAPFSAVDDNAINYKPSGVP